jgi:large repetitive protein
VPDQNAPLSPEDFPRPKDEGDLRSKKSRFQIESLEARILMSATWVEGEAEAQDAEAQDAAAEEELDQLYDALESEDEGLFGAADAAISTAGTDADDGASDGGLNIANLSSLPQSSDGELQQSQTQQDRGELREESLSLDAADGDDGGLPEGLVIHSMDSEVGETDIDAAVSAQDATGLEDGSVPLDIEIPEEGVISVTISGVPEGAELSSGVDNGDGSWSLAAGDVEGLELELPADSDADFELTIDVEIESEDPGQELDLATATVDDYYSENYWSGAGAGEINGDTLSFDDYAYNTIDFNYEVTADTVIEFEFRSTIEGNIHSIGFVNDNAVSGAQNLQVHGVHPWGHDVAEQYTGDGAWQTIRIPVGEYYTGEFEQLVFTNWPSGWGQGADSDFRDIRVFEDVTSVTTATATLNVTVNAQADAAVVHVADTDGFEDQAIPLNLAATLADTDGSEQLAVTISGLPEGASLSQGIDLGDGTWSVDPAALGDLEFTPPLDFSGEIELTLIATTTEGENADQTLSSQTFTVSVEGVADAVTLDVGEASGDEDTAIPLTINAGSTDSDGSESVVVTVSGVPEGATLSAGTNNGDGSWTLAEADLPGLSLTPPEDFSGDIDLEIRVQNEGGETALPGIDLGDPNAIMTAFGGSFDSSEGRLEVTSPGTSTAVAVLDFPPLSGDFDISVDVTPGPEGSYQNGFIVFDYQGPNDFKFAGARDGANYWTVGHFDGNWNDNLTLPETINSSQTYDFDLSARDGVVTLTVDGVEKVSFDFDEDLDGHIGVANERAVTEFENFAVNSDSSSTDGTIEITETLTVSVTGVADLASLSGSDAAGGEGEPIPLDIQVEGNDLDNSELIVISIAGVPEGAELSAGHLQNDGTWSLHPTQLEGLTITSSPGSDADLDLTVTATTIEAGPPIDLSAAAIDSHGGSNQDISGTAEVDADGALHLAGNLWKSIEFPADISPDTILEFEYRSSAEGEIQGIGFDNDASLTESQSFKIQGTQNWGIQNAASYDGDGAWQTLRIPVGEFFTGEFDRITFINDHDVANPDSEGSFRNLRLFDLGDISGDSASTSIDIHVEVEARADAADLSAFNVTGNEDEPIPLALEASLSDSDGSESLSLLIQGVPEGATLSAGIDHGDGTWSLAASELSDLEFTAPPNFSGEVQLELVATTTEASNGHETVTIEDFSVYVQGVADAPELAADEASGVEDSAIPLTISISGLDTDGSETTSVVISGVPEGASLSAGVDLGDGSWELSPDELEGLSITPSDDSDGDFTLTVTATSVESSSTPAPIDLGGAPIQSHGGANQDITGSAEVDSEGALHLEGNLWKSIEFPYEMSPDTILEFEFRSTQEGEIQGIGFDSDAGLTSSSTFKLQGTQSWGIQDAAHYDGDGEWQTIRIPVGEYLSGDFDRIVFVNDHDVANPDSNSSFRNIRVFEEAPPANDTATSSIDVQVTVNAVADAATVSATDVTGIEDQPIALQIDADLSDTDGSESLAVTITGMPDGSTLSAGIDNGDGTWSVDPSDLADIEFTAPENFSGEIELTLVATTTEAENGDQSVVTQDFTVAVEGVADAPILSGSDAAGAEDSAIPLAIATATTDADGSESIAITISGVPDGASLSAGIDNGDGTWSLEPGQLSGLTLTPGADSAEDFTLTVTSTATEADGDTATSSIDVNVTVNATADDAAVSVADVSGLEDQPIALQLDADLSDTDGSENLAVTITGMPEGATLSAGIDNGDGTWSMDPADLADIEFTAPENFSGEIELTLVATTTEAENGDQSVVTQSFTVAVEGVADAPTLTGSDAAGAEDSAIPLAIASTTTDTDGSESIAVTISGVPEGAALSAGIDNGDGTWSLEPGQLTGLMLTPGENASEDFTLTVTSTATEADGDTATSSIDVNVTVNATADDAAVSVADVSGLEDQPIALQLDADLSDTDGSESLAVTITGMPEGSTLSAGADNGDGTWSVDPADLADIEFTASENFSGEIELTLVAATTEAENGDQSVVTQSFTVAVEGVADAALTEAADVDGLEDAVIPLDLNVALLDTDGSERVSIRIEGLPPGAQLTAGTPNADGTWSIDPHELEDLGLVPPPDMSGTILLDLVAETSEGDSTAESRVSFSVNVQGVVDDMDLGMEVSNGMSGEHIPIVIEWGLGDHDGSETLNFVISGLPPGAELSAGTSIGPESWALSPEDIEGLTLRTDPNTSGTFSLLVTAIVSEDDGAVREFQVTSNVEIALSGVPEAPPSVDAPDFADLGPASTETSDLDEDRLAPRPDVQELTEIHEERATRQAATNLGVELEPPSSVETEPPTVPLTPERSEFAGQTVLAELREDGSWAQSTTDESWAEENSKGLNEEDEGEPGAKKAGFFGLLFTLFRARGADDQRDAESRRARS